MISAPPMNGVTSGHGHPHGMPMHSPGRSLGQLHHRAMDTERMCMDAQKFLVPSLPVSLRSGTVSDPSAGKRRLERSILNGTVIPPDTNNNNSYSSRHVGLDRARRPVPFPYLNGTSHSPGQGKSSDVMDGSPRKVDRIPTYSGKSSGITNGGGSTSGDRSVSHGLQPPYPHHHHQMPSNPAHFHSPRSSMPIPCSSPAPASSASPKAISPSTHHNHNGVAPSHYSPQLPGTDLNSRHYAGGYPHHPSMGLAPSHTAAFYAAAAAAAAASHSLPYPLFGSSFPLSHAAASSYLDNFHSNILAQQQQQQQHHQLKKVAAASPSPPSRAQGTYYSQHSNGGHVNPPAMSPHRQPQATSERERYNGNGASHGQHAHSLGYHHQNEETPTRELNGHGHYQSYPCSGLSKGGPLGMGHLDMTNGFTVPRLPPPASTNRKITAKESPKSTFSSSQSSAGVTTKNKVTWSERPPSPSSMYANYAPSHMTNPRMLTKEMINHPHHHHYQSTVSVRPTHHQESSLSIRPTHHNGSTARPTNHPTVAHHPRRDWEGGTVKVRSRSPDSPGPNSAMVQRILNTSIFDFPTGRSASPPGHAYSNGAGHMHGLFEYEPSRDKALDLNTKTKTTAVHHHSPFLTPSPKKSTNSQYWDMTISHVNTSTASRKLEATTHQSYIPPSGGTLDFAKYLTQFPKPSNYSASSTTTTSSIYLRPSTAQIPSIPPPAHHASSVPSSPTAIPTSRYSTFPTRFTFTPPKAGGTSTESKPSTPTVLITPVSKQMMPDLMYFKRGSKIELASGKKLYVEDMSELDFLQSAELDGGVKILRCTLMSIEGQELIGVGQNSNCKLILRVEGQENQEVSIQATPEQPFFVEGRGWSSLSPISSQNLLQLNCFHLQIGDVCLTLTRADHGTANTPPGFASSPTLNAIFKRTLGDNNGNLSPRVTLTASRINKPVSILSASKIAKYNLKAARSKDPSSPASPGGLGFPKSKSGNGRSKLCMASLEMLPPPLPIPSAKSTENIPPTSVLTIEIPNTAKPNYPQSPKKRRWSAPPAETRIDDEAQAAAPPSPKKPAENLQMD